MCFSPAHAPPDTPYILAHTYFGSAGLGKTVFYSIPRNNPNLVSISALGITYNLCINPGCGNIPTLCNGYELGDDHTHGTRDDPKLGDISTLGDSPTLCNDPKFGNISTLGDGPTLCNDPNFGNNPKFGNSSTHGNNPGNGNNPELCNPVFHSISRNNPNFVDTSELNITCNLCNNPSCGNISALYNGYNLGEDPTYGYSHTYALKLTIGDKPTICETAFCPILRDNHSFRNIFTLGP